MNSSRESNSLKTFRFPWLSLNCLEIPARHLLNQSSASRLRGGSGSPGVPQPGTQLKAEDCREQIIHFSFRDPLSFAGQESRER